MTRITVKTNANIVRQGLEDLAGDIPQVGRRRLRTTMERVKRRMQEYPGERAGQSARSSHPVLGTIIRAVRYRRTGNYGRGWVIEGADDGYAIKNNVSRKGRSYAKYVGGDAYGNSQAWMHKGRWPLLRDVVEDEVKKLPDVISKDIQLAARRRGLA